MGWSLKKSPNNVRPVLGTDGRYGVTRRGQVWSCRFQMWRKPYVNTTGYLCVSVCVNYRKRNRYIHRIIAEAWIPNPKRLPHVNHKDGDKINNRLSNLEWCSKSDDVRHAWRIGLMKMTVERRAKCAAHGKRMARAWAKLNMRKARRIRHLCAAGMSQRAAGERYGVARESVRQVVRGISYKEAV